MELPYSPERAMDILVMVEENADLSSVLAHVNSIPAPLHGSERPSRDIVTVYGVPTAETVGKLNAVTALDVQAAAALIFRAAPTLAAMGPADHVPKLPSIAERLAA